MIIFQATHLIKYPDYKRHARSTQIFMCVSTLLMLLIFIVPSWTMYYYWIQGDGMLQAFVSTVGSWINLLPKVLFMTTEY